MPSSMNFDPSASISAIGQLSSEQQDRLTALLDEYLKRLEGGIPPDTAAVAAANPDLADVFLTYIRQIETLHSVAAGFASSNTTNQEASDTQPDEQRLGDFVLLKEVGRGGMGVVYEGRQISLGRRVAVKVLPFAAVLDSKQISRFKNEAQAAAQVLHPNIVPVFAIGVDRGVHYYAMQFIDGQPLDRAIAEMRNAQQPHPAEGSVSPSPTVAGDDTIDWQPSHKSPPAELVATRTEKHDVTNEASFLAQQSKLDSDYFRCVAQLGIQAAEAVHAAHEYGVVHRDVKPSNLLVDPAGKLWVTDFGLARCQSEGTLTKTGDLLGTLRYMSPEQASGNASYVDHRTDIYSLGATLYELLTLQPAFPGQTNAQLLKQIESNEPPSPRQLRPSIPADLETVVLKAMSKDRDDRYPTAKRLADDLRCFLEGRPTVARPPSLIDRMTRWSRRHFRVVSTTAAVGLVLTCVFAVSTLLVTSARIESEASLDKAEQHLRDTRKAVEYFAIRVPELLKDVPGGTRAHLSFLQECKPYYQMFLEQSVGDPTLQAEAALWHSKLATINDRLGQREEAIAEHQLALSLFSELAREAPDNLEYERNIGLCQNNLGQILSESRHDEEAQTAFQDALKRQRQLVKRSDDAIHRADLARTQNNYALFLAGADRHSLAQQSFEASIEEQQKLVAEDPQNPAKLQHLATYYQNLSRLLAPAEPAQAVSYCEDAIQAYTALVSTAPTSAEYQNALALAYHSMGVINNQLDKHAAAQSAFEASAKILNKLHRAAPYVKSYTADLALTLNDLGRIYHTSSTEKRSQEAFAKALSLQHEVIQLDPSDANLHHTLGGIYNNLGLVLEKSNELNTAVKAFERAVQAQEKARELAPQVERFRNFLSKHYYNWGRVLRKLERPQDAVRATNARKSLWSESPDRMTSIAEELAMAAELMDGQLKSQTENQAIDALTIAVNAGFVDSLDALPGSLQRLRKNPKLTKLFNLKESGDSNIQSATETEVTPKAGV